VRKCAWNKPLALQTREACDRNCVSARPLKPYNHTKEGHDCRLVSGTAQVSALAAASPAECGSGRIGCTCRHIHRLGSQEASVGPARRIPHARRVVIRPGQDARTSLFHAARHPILMVQKKPLQARRSQCIQQGLIVFGVNNTVWVTCRPVLAQWYRLAQVSSGRNPLPLVVV
jgi:hypothetical protein